MQTSAATKTCSRESCARTWGRESHNRSQYRLYRHSIRESQYEQQYAIDLLESFDSLYGSALLAGSWHLFSQLGKRFSKRATLRILRRCMFKAKTSMEHPGCCLSWIQSWRMPFKNVLQRNPGNEAPRELKFTGYNWNACKKFPQNWEIRTKQWEEPDEEEWGTDGYAECDEENEESDVDSELP